MGAACNHGAHQKEVEGEHDGGTRDEAVLAPEIQVKPPKDKVTPAIVELAEAAAAAEEAVAAARSEKSRVARPRRSQSMASLASIDSMLDLPDEGWTCRVRRNSISSNESYLMVFPVRIDAAKHQRAYGRQRSLGIDLKQSYINTEGLLVIQVKDGGLVADWNKEHPSTKVQEDDIIISVNGISGEHKDMLDAIGQHGKLDLMVRRMGVALAGK